MSEPSTVAIDSLSFLDVFSSSYREDRLDLIEVLSEALHMASSPHGLELLSYDLCFAVAVATHVPSSFFWYLIGAPTADRGLVADCSDSLLKVFRANPAYRGEIEIASQSQTLKSQHVAHDRLAEHTEQWEMLRVETLRSDFLGLRRSEG
jgi:hypothetical protein